MAQAKLNLRGVANMKRRLARSILAHLGPHLYASGYRTKVDPSRPLFNKGNTRPLLIYRADNALDLVFCDDFFAVTEFGIIADAHSGGCVQMEFSDLAFEDLMRVETWAIAEANRLNTLVAA